MDNIYNTWLGIRMALVTNIPRPYRIPLYTAINASIERSGGTLHVLYYSNPQHHKLRRGILEDKGNYPNEFVSGIGFTLGYDRVISLPFGLWVSLARFQPEVLISGSFGPAGYLGWLYSQRAHIPYIQWSGATSVRQGQGGPLVALSQGWLVRRADACITYGSAATEYLQSLGACSERIVTGVNANDHHFFQEQFAIRADEARRIRLKNSIQGVNLLYVGNLVRLKGLIYLLQALQPLLTKEHNFQLHLLGSGPQEAELRRKVQELGLESRVHFWGACQPQEVPLYYAMSDVMIFPSLYDVWGLVLNEAMACGLPVIASALAGATRDLVEDGINGFVVDPRNTPAFTQALSRLITDDNLRTRMGVAARKTIESKATIEHSASAFIQAIQMVLT